MNRPTFKKHDILLHQSRRGGYTGVLPAGKLCVAIADEEPGILSGRDNNYIRVRGDEGKTAAAHATRFKLILRCQ